jgi:uncharacterized protein YfiM (DUF2279 family)
MRFLAKLAGLFMLALAVVAGLLFLALDRKPLVDRDETVSPVAVAQARLLFATNDPRRMLPGEQRQTSVPAALIDEGINYLASRGLHGRGALVLGEETAEVRITFRPPGLPGSRFVNLRATIREAEGQPRIASAAIGSLPVPASLAEYVLVSGLRSFGHEQDWNLARGAIRRLSFEPARQTIVVSYVWEPALLEHARSMTFSQENQARILRAQATLTGLLDRKASATPVTLSSILVPLLAAGDEQSLEQRRAALLVLATYMAEKNLATLLPEAGRQPRPRQVMLTLQNRYDSAQHFAVSAALAAWAGEPAADAIGLYKELDDARHGSGFSFADLAADRAGTRFGELVAQNSPRVDELLRGSVADVELAPRLDDLPEDLPEHEFRRRYGGPGSPAYQQVAAEIEHRLTTLSLYR